MQARFNNETDRKFKDIDTEFDHVYGRLNSVEKWVERAKGIAIGVGIIGSLPTTILAIYAINGKIH